MIMDTVVKRFVEQSPITVMARWRYSECWNRNGSMRYLSTIHTGTVVFDDGGN